MTMVPKNARDKVLQAALVRTEPVTLPPSVTVPPGQLGAGSLPGTVTGSNGTTLVNVGNFQAQTVIANQVDTRGLTIKDAAGNVVFSAGVPLSSNRVSGLGTLASLSELHLSDTNLIRGQINANTQIINLGKLAYADTITAENIIGGSFTGKTFVGGTFDGGTFTGGRFVANVVNFEKASASVYLDAWDLYSHGTSWLTNVRVEKSIDAAGANLDVHNTITRGSATIFNMAVTGAVTSNLLVRGNISAPNIFLENDVRAPYIYASGFVQAGTVDVNVLNVNGRLGGAIGDRVCLAETTRWCEITIDGVTHTTKIKLGALG